MGRHADSAVFRPPSHSARYERLCIIMELQRESPLFRGFYSRGCGLTCLPSRALEGRRGRQTIDSSAVPQILGCVRLPAAYSGCRSPPPIAPTGYHPAWRKYATRLSVGIMAAWRRRTVEEIPMMPQQPSPTHITAINRKYQEAENL